MKLAAASALRNLRAGGSGRKPSGFGDIACSYGYHTFSTSNTGAGPDHGWGVLRKAGHVVHWNAGNQMWAHEFPDQREVRGTGIASFANHLQSVHQIVAAVAGENTEIKKKGPLIPVNDQMHKRLLKNGYKHTANYETKTGEGRFGYYEHPVSGHKLVVNEDGQMMDQPPDPKIPGMKQQQQQTPWRGGFAKRSAGDVYRASSYPIGGKMKLEACIEMSKLNAGGPGSGRHPGDTRDLFQSLTYSKPATWDEAKHHSVDYNKLGDRQKAALASKPHFRNNNEDVLRSHPALGKSRLGHTEYVMQHGRDHYYTNTEGYDYPRYTVHLKNYPGKP